MMVAAREFRQRRSWRKSSSKAGTAASPADLLNDRLRHLNLREDDEEEVVPEELEKDAEFMVLARVYTNRKVSHGAFYGNTRSA